MHQGPGVAAQLDNGHRRFVASSTLQLAECRVGLCFKVPAALYFCFYIYYMVDLEININFTGICFVFRWLQLTNGQLGVVHSSLTSLRHEVLCRLQCRGRKFFADYSAEAVCIASFLDHETSSSRVDLSQAATSSSSQAATSSCSRKKNRVSRNSRLTPTVVNTLWIVGDTFLSPTFFYLWELFLIKNQTPVVTIKNKLHKL
jgi:hypothetical protein